MKSQAKYSLGYQPRLYPKDYRAKENKSRKRIIFFILILFFILALGYFLFFSPIFKVKEIKISGGRAIGSDDIYKYLNDFRFKKVLIFFNHDNIFLLTKSKLRNILIDRFSRILSIQISKDIFKKNINIQITERKEVGIYCQAQNLSEEILEGCYYIDSEGVIFEQAPQTSGTLILVIKDYSGKEIKIRNSVLDKELMVKFIELRDILSSQFSLKALDFVIGNDAIKGFRLDTNEGWYILFDGSRDLESQIMALQLVLEEKIKEARKNLEYIDLRIENRVYYK